MDNTDSESVIVNDPGLCVSSRTKLSSSSATKLTVQDDSSCTNTTLKSDVKFMKSSPAVNDDSYLDSEIVSNWLDNHPEFLNEYLKKLQIKRRSSIMNDKSGLLLANLHSNLRMQAQSIDFNYQTHLSIKTSGFSKNNNYG